MAPSSSEQQSSQTPYLNYWGELASHPEWVGVEPFTVPEEDFVTTAMKQLFLSLDSDRVLRSVVNDGSSDFIERATELWGSRAELIYGTADRWYRSLGPTNRLAGAEQLLWGAAFELLAAARSVDGPPNRGMYALAGDLNYEAALLYEGQNPELGRGLCKDAKDCYEQAVLEESEGLSLLRQWSMVKPAWLNARYARATFQATNRYHDLGFFMARARMWKIFDGSWNISDGSENDEAEAWLADAETRILEAEAPLLVGELRNRQKDALNDFQSALDLCSSVGSDGKPLFTARVLEGQFATLALRHELISHYPGSQAINGMLATSVRNALPRESSLTPVLSGKRSGDSRVGPPSNGISTVVDTYDRTGALADRVHYRIGTREGDLSLPGVYDFPVPQGFGDREVPIVTVRNMRLWTKQMLAELVVAPGDERAREQIRNARNRIAPIPFVLYS